MAEAATATVKHHHDLVRNRDPEFFREIPVAHVFWPGDLHLEIMVPAAKCADLIVAALDRAVADFQCVGARDTTVLLGEFEVFLPTHLALNAPACALLYQVSKFVM